MWTITIETVTGFLTLAGLIAAGIFGLVAMWRQNTKKNQDEVDEIENRVIQLLKERVEALEHKTKDQETNLSQLTTKFNSLIQENKILRDVLQGKDSNFLEYQKNVLSGIKIIHEVVPIIQTSNKNIEKLVKALDRHLSKQDG